MSVILTDDTEEVLAENTEAVENCDSWDDLTMPWDDKEGEFTWIYEDGAEIPMNKRYLEYRVPGIVTGVNLTKVKATGAAMGIVTIEYGRHELTFACFSNKWPKSKFMFKPHNVGIFTIRHSAPNSNRGEGYHFEQGRLLK